MEIKGQCDWPEIVGREGEIKEELNTYLVYVTNILGSLVKNYYCIKNKLFCIW